MTTLPRLKFSDFLVDASPVTPLLRECAFAKYLTIPHQFDIDMAAQSATIEALSRVLSDNKAAPKIVEGLAETVITWRRWVGLQKVPAVVATVRAELDKDLYPKLVVVASHRDTLTELRDGLKKYNAMLLFEGTPGTKRDKIMKLFAKHKRNRVLCTEAGALRGCAVDLTAASDMLFVEADWVLERNVNTILRMHNARQLLPVRVRFARLSGSMDAKVQRCLLVHTRRAVNAYHGYDVTAAAIDPFA